MDLSAILSGMWQPFLTFLLNACVCVCVLLVYVCVQVHDIINCNGQIVLQQGATHTLHNSISIEHIVCLEE